ncbi:Microtubule-nucleating Tub4p (gamma-tubulin) complex component [Collariella sp. IMI 366227]|nr:Microtubule-nucleating Tub4p (gamma-tubulin) complex component [Collariella sp. IMI 366227]
MANNQRSRVSNAIDSLITHLVPASPSDDDDSAQERHDACFETPRLPAISSDVNHASDLIKRKLIQSNPSQALRFSNLYTRLLSLPVLNQKWAILYLLYQLSDSPDPNEPLPLSPPKPPSQRAPSRPLERGGRSRASTTVAATPEEELVQAAFAPGGLKKLPTERVKRPRDAAILRHTYDILRRWIYDGELSDPHLEFFVREQRPDDEDRKETKAKGQASVWNSKYEVVDSMVPSIITADFAQKVFLIGKSLNFIRHSCGDSQWVDAYSKTSSKQLSYGDTATLETWIDEAYKTTMRRLMHLMSNRFHLFDHLQALKNYILLGQGDFIALLMESLAANLDRPAFAQYRHTLTAQLEHAIRGSNAQFDSEEVLRRLDARMLQLSHGDIGWDCFTLEYKIDAPVDVVVTEWGNRQYLKVFNFLWRVKRVEFALSSTWRKCMTGARGVLHTTDDAVLQTWKSTRGTLAEMVHFSSNPPGPNSKKNIRKEDCTLDDLITAHTRYLTAITHKGLLGARRRQYHDALREQQGAGTTTTDPEGDRNSYMVQLSELLRTMLAYRDCVDGLYSWSLSDFTRRQEADAVGMMRRNKRPKLSASVDLDDPFTTNTSTTSFASDAAAGGSLRSELPALQERLRQLGSGFKARLQVLLGDLAYQPDVDMRFLGVSMNFNDVYQPVRRKKGASASQASGAWRGAAVAGANMSRA